jgi:two-component system sensor histidine kinase SenX3
MDEVAVVVDASLQIVAVSAPAELFGMHEGYALPGDELRALVRRRAAPRRRDADAAARRGVEPRLVTARASVITPRLTSSSSATSPSTSASRRCARLRRQHQPRAEDAGGAVSLAEAVESAADDPDQVRHFARRLSAEASRLGQLTSRIMNLAPAVRRRSHELRDVSVDEVVAAAIESQSVAADPPASRSPAAGARYVRGDVQVLTEAIGNLVANAIAYSPRRAGRRRRATARSSRSPSPIAASAFPRTSRSACSSGSTAPTRRARAAPAARARPVDRQARRAAARRRGRGLVASRAGSTFTVRLPAIPRARRSRARRSKKKKKKAPACGEGEKQRPAS